MLDAEPSVALANPNVECVNFVSDPGFFLQQANGWTIYFEGNATPDTNNHGRYNPGTHGAYALNARGERVLDGTITYLNTTNEHVRVDHRSDEGRAVGKAGALLAQRYKKIFETARKRPHGWAPPFRER